VRRIEALTGTAARHHLEAESRQFRALAALLKAQPAEAEQRLSALIDDRKRLERELSDAKKKLAMGGGDAGAASEIRKLGDVAFIGRVLSGVDVKDLKPLADQAKAQLGSGVVALVATGEDGRAGVVVGVTPDLTPRFDAVALVRLASETLGGKGGGGRPDLAQAGGPDGGRAADAIEAVAGALA
jgi:alanyl-tRNA synthetase